MLLRLIAVFILGLGLSGCVTTKSKGEVEQLQSRVTALEKKVEEKDAEIVDLQYGVKDLSSKVSSSNTVAADQPSPEPEAKSVSAKSPDAGHLIRVDVSTEKVQTALKNAGVYNGKIDGKAGHGTKAAIVAFQKQHGLKADGVLGKKTWEELKTYLQ